MREEALLSMWVMTVVVLLPMIPSFILFKFLPSTGAAEGPFKGIAFRFSGAFAAYLAVFLALFSIRPVETNHYHTWTVTGRLDFAPAPGTPRPDARDVYVRFTPPQLTVFHGGLFRWELPVLEDRDGELQFPDVQLDLAGYAGITIPLAPARRYGTVNLQVDYDHAGREIVLADPIVLSATAPAPAYGTAGGGS
jgi:hypothetical protein